MASIRLLVCISSLLALVHSQNICSPSLKDDSQLCSLRADSCTSPLVRSVCQRYCGVCVDADGSDSVTPMTFTDPGVDISCQDESQICDRFANSCIFEKIKLKCRRTCGLCGDSPVTPATATAKATDPSSATVTTKDPDASTSSPTAPTNPQPSSASVTSASGSSTEKSTVQLTTIDKDTDQLIKSAILLTYISERKMQAEVRLVGRIDRPVLEKIGAEMFDLLRRFAKPIERITITDVEDYRTKNNVDITVMTLDVFLKSDGKKTVDNLNSDSSAFRYQLLKNLDFILTSEEYQGLYGGAIPGPQTEGYVENETTTRRSDWWVHEYWYVILIVVLAFVILLVGAIIVPIALDRRRHQGIKIIDNGLAHTRV